MSIAAVSSSFVAAVRGSSASTALEPVAPAGAAQRSAGGGRRHDLVDAMNQALGVDGAQSKPEAQAVFRLAHALMHDLRALDAGGSDGPGRARAWGRRDWSDLAQRIDALATAAATPPGELPAAPPGAPVTAAAAAAEIAPDELPPQPNPITATSAAVHLMQVPSMRLLEAYTALREALEQSEPQAPEAARGELAAFLDRLSQQLAPDAPAALPAGSVLNLTA